MPPGKNLHMTHDDLDRRIADVVRAARDAGMSDAAIIEVLLDHVDALGEQMDQHHPVEGGGM